MKQYCPKNHDTFIVGRDKTTNRCKQCIRDYKREHPRKPHKKENEIKKFCVHGHDIAIIGRDRWGRCIECSKIAGRNPSKERKEKKQAYQRWWNEKNKEKIKKQRKLNNRLQRLKRYNLTPEKYDAMLKAQKGLCAGCLQDSKNDRIPLAIDHDHVCCPEFKSCGKCIRGLLCYQCNSVLGYIKDDVNVLKRLIKYLNKNKEK